MAAPPCYYLPHEDQKRPKPTTPEEEGILDGMKTRAGRAHARLKSIGVPTP